MSAENFYGVLGRIVEWYEFFIVSIPNEKLPSTDTPSDTLLFKVKYTLVQIT